MSQKEYLYTDRTGTAVFAGDTVKSYHSQFSDKAFIVGIAVARGNIEWGCSDTDYLTIEVQCHVQTWVDEDGDTIWHRMYDKEGTTVHPACVPIELGGAVIELMTSA